MNQFTFLKTKFIFPCHSVNNKKKNQMNLLYSYVSLAALSIVSGFLTLYHTIPTLNDSAYEAF